MSPYWLCQLLGWSLQGLLTAAIPTLYGGLRWTVVARAVLGAILGIVLTDQLRRHIHRKGWLRLPPLRLVPRLTAASLAIAATIVLGVMPFLVRIIPPGRTGPIAAVFAGQTTVVLVWCGIYVAVHYLRGLRAAEAEKWRLELAMQDTELRALRAQLNPHFLFNSLNSLRGLVTEDPARAQEAITGLAALLRFTLLSSRARTITLERELEATRHYLDLEALRFEARLRHRIDVDPGALEVTGRNRVHPDPLRSELHRHYSGELIRPTLRRDPRPGMPMMDAIDEILMIEPPSPWANIRRAAACDALSTPERSTSST